MSSSGLERSRFESEKVKSLQLCNGSDILKGAVVGREGRAERSARLTQIPGWDNW